MLMLNQNTEMICQQFLMFLFILFIILSYFYLFVIEMVLISIRSHLVNPSSPCLIDVYGLCRPLCSLQLRIQMFWTKQTTVYTEHFAFLKALPVVRLEVCPEDDARVNLIESFQSKQLMNHSKCIDSLLLHKIMHKIITLHKIILCFAQNCHFR